MNNLYELNAKLDEVIELALTDRIVGKVAHIPRKPDGTLVRQRGKSIKETPPIRKKKRSRKHLDPNAPIKIIKKSKTQGEHNFAGSRGRRGNEQIRRYGRRRSINPNKELGMKMSKMYELNAKLDEVLEFAKKDILGSWKKLKAGRQDRKNAEAHKHHMNKLYDRLAAIRAGKAFPRHGEFGTAKLR
jgi:hypothetical protein